MYSPSLFMSSAQDIMIAVYVDDCIVAAKTDSQLDIFISKLQDRFSLEIIGIIENDILDTDILGMDLSYDYNKGTIKLKLESYIDTLKDEYPNILKNHKGTTLSPHSSQYTINPKAEKLQLTNGEEKN